MRSTAPHAALIAPLMMASPVASGKKLNPPGRSFNAAVLAASALRIKSVPGTIMPPANTPSAVNASTVRAVPALTTMDAAPNSR